MISSVHYRGSLVFSILRDILRYTIVMRYAMADVEMISRSVAEMAATQFKGLADPYRVVALTAEKRMAFLHNPFVDDMGSHCQAIGVKDKIAIGGEIHFPLYWSVRGEQVKALYGSTTFVAKEYRKTELGLRFPEFRKKVYPSDVTGGAGCSQMMIKVLRYRKELVFLMPRMIMLFKSRSVVEMKLRGWISKLVTAVIDFGLQLYWCCMKFIVGFKLRGYVFETVKDNDYATVQQVADLIATDTHPYAELHDVCWLKWHLTESFTKDGPMKLTAVKRKGKLIGFYMTKVRFHEQASARGFKNVWLGSIMEWQTQPDEEAALPWILLHASCAFKGTVDAVEIVTTDSKVTSLLRLVMWHQVGDSNFTFHIHAGALKEDPEILLPENWRLRPAMGDVGLS